MTPDPQSLQRAENVQVQKKKKRRGMGTAVQALVTCLLKGPSIINTVVHGPVFVQLQQVSQIPQTGSTDSTCNQGKRKHMHQ